MGNCQAIDTATLVIQQPNGKEERLYWPVTASEVMKTHPDHYVALLISTTLCTSKDKENCSNKSSDNNNDNNNNKVRITRIKLLKPTDTLLLGQVYRLISTQGQLLQLHLSFDLFLLILYIVFHPYRDYFVLSNLSFMLFLVSEVTKGMWAKKQAKMKRNSLPESAQKSNQIKERINDKTSKRSEPEDNKVNLN